MATDVYVDGFPALATAVGRTLWDGNSCTFEQSWTPIEMSGTEFPSWHEGFSGPLILLDRQRMNSFVGNSSPIFSHVNAHSVARRSETLTLKPPRRIALMKPFVSSSRT